MPSSIQASSIPGDVPLPNTVCFHRKVEKIEICRIPTTQSVFNFQLFSLAIILMWF